MLRSDTHTPKTEPKLSPPGLDRDRETTVEGWVGAKGFRGEGRAGDFFKDIGERNNKRERERGSFFFFLTEQWKEREMGERHKGKEERQATAR